MANMSYCRWHNTSMDVEDCFEAFYNGWEMSAEEIRCAKRMIRNMCDFLLDNGVIEEYDYDDLMEKFDDMIEY